MLAKESIRNDWQTWVKQMTQLEFLEAMIEAFTSEIAGTALLFRPGLSPPGYKTMFERISNILRFGAF